MTQREIIRNNLNKSDWEIRKDKCDSTRAQRRHLAANGKHKNKRKFYCTNVHLRIIEILMTLMYNLSAVTAAVTFHCPLLIPVCCGLMPLVALCRGPFCGLCGDVLCWRMCRLLWRCALLACGLLCCLVPRYAVLWCADCVVHWCCTLPPPPPPLVVGHGAVH